MKTITLIICLTLFSGFAFSQWVQQNISPSMPALTNPFYFNSVCFTDANTGYAVSNVILKTIDGGANWDTLSCEIKGSLNSVFFTDTNKGFVAGGDQSGNGVIYKTTNGGLTWTSWTCLECGARSNLISVYFTDANTGYAVGDGGIILKTTDGGTSWKAKSVITSYSLNSVYFTDEIIGYTVGNYWNSGGIFKTTNGGTTWHQLQSNTNTLLYSVFFIDANTGWATGINGTILKTSDGGLTWNSVSSGTTSKLTSVYFTDANSGYAVSDSGSIIKTINGGTTWTGLSSGTTEPLNSVFFTDVNTGYAVGGNKYVSPNSGGILLKTNDAGSTWSILIKGTKPSPQGFINLNSVHFTDANNGYAVGGKYESWEDHFPKGIILKTIDGGARWDTIWINNTFEYESTLTSVFFTDANNGIVVGDFGILKTTDGGLTWDIDFYYWGFKSVCFTDKNTGYIAGSEIYKTIDGGLTWTTTYSIPSYNFNLIHFPDANTGYAWGTNGKIHKTNDGGATWTELSSGTVNKINSVYFIDANTGYAVGNEGTMIKTTDGGLNWTTLWKVTYYGEDYFDINSVFFTDTNTGYVVGGCHGHPSWPWSIIDHPQRIILKTIDGGATWENTLLIGQSSFLNSIFFTDANTGYAVGRNGAILKTTNGGGFPTSVENVSLESTFTVYPNPATNKISIAAQSNQQGETTICIFNMNGAILQQNNFQSQNLIEMDVSVLAKGIYLLQIQTKAGVETKKLVVQ